ncbi:peptidase M42 family protein [Magnetococcus marinus MC-1]|uniref:Peptidase M42 family protein n=1 Tax=Magnetococcus marinus (strain ATCC BAA-1437 / JCM 17883 / MC-1) TaxID=156889 RepID=A0L454_MAGMM|nr:osmoprotectant NAGGN system M42 family peptidase [Magnetococcus marinus]ABK42747.1 peptidase M42 family protein [Magnetococcus marinus MC-1]
MSDQHASNAPIINTDYLLETLLTLLTIPSPSGMTDKVVRWVCHELTQLGVEYELTHRGAIRATLPGKDEKRVRGVVAHLDTLGAMVRELKGNGRLSVSPIGHWNGRFAEGARVTLMAESGRHMRGTLLPLKASGHVYNEAIDSQPAGWDYVELRLDERAQCVADLMKLGVHVGDYVAVDSAPEVSASGFVNARHLDDKAGVAAMLAAVRTIMAQDITLPAPVYVMFTISEEVGVGASHILHGDISELVSVDNGTLAPGQNTCEFGVTIAMKDSSGPFDYHLTHHLLDLCKEHAIMHSRDVFRYYRSDAAAALEAGNDIRTALVCFGLDASHGYERIHMDSLHALAALLFYYMNHQLPVPDRGM